MKRTKLDLATRRVLRRKGRTYKPRSKSIIVDGARATWYWNEIGISRIFVVPIKPDGVN